MISSFGTPLDPGVIIPEYAFLEPTISNIPSATLGINATETITSNGMYAKLKNHFTSENTYSPRSPSFPAISVSPRNSAIQ